MGAMIGFSPLRLVQCTLPEIIHLYRGFQLQRGIDPDHHRKNPPMSRKRMADLFEAHEAKKGTKAANTASL